MNKLCILFTLFIFPLIAEEALSQNEIRYLGYAKGEPYWTEETPLPPAGTVDVAFCAKKPVYLPDHSPDSMELKMGGKWVGHCYTECRRSDGSISSVSTCSNSHDPKHPYLSSNDHVDYKSDPNVIRIVIRVPEDLANKLLTEQTLHAEEPYNLFYHCCTDNVAIGAKIVGVDKELFPVHIKPWGEFPTWKPSEVYSNIHTLIKELTYQPLSPRELRDQITWVYLAAEDPYFPALGILPASVQFEAMYNLPQMMTINRGNFGGISLSKQASLCLNLEEIYGALFDKTTYELFLIGKKRIQLPSMRLDDLAVAIQSLYGLRGKPPEDPGVSIDLNLSTEDRMVVRYLGQTEGTTFGKLLFEGDLTLKQLVLGDLSCRIAGFQSYATRFLEKYEHNMNQCRVRTWLLPEHISLIQSMDGSAMIFEETKMRCYAETGCGQEMDTRNPAHEEFVEFFTTHYEEIASEYPIFSELKRLGQITGVIKWLKDHHIPFNVQFFEAYQPTAVFTPATIPSIKTHLTRNHFHVNLTGGISYRLNPQNFAIRSASSTDVFKQKVLDSRPTEDTLNWDFEEQSVQVLPLAKTRRSGDFRVVFIDLELPSLGNLPLLLTRFYDSFNEEDIGLGRGWVITPFKAITALQDSVPFVVIREGNEHWVYQNRQGLYFREDGQQYLYENSDSSWTLCTKDQTILFNAQGELIQVNQPHAITQFLYQEGKLSQILGPSGQTILFTYAGDRLCKAVASNGASMTYQLNPQGQLETVLDHSEKPKMVYGYDADQRVTRIVGSDGEVLFRGSYDDYHRLITYKWNFLPKM